MTLLGWLLNASFVDSVDVGDISDASGVAVGTGASASNANASGGQGGHGGSVTINIEALRDEQPQTAHEYLQSLWLMVLTIQQDTRDYRAERESIDAKRHAVQERHQRVMYAWLVGLTAALVVAIVTIFLLHFVVHARI